MQNHYNLVYREEEREMFPTLKLFGVGSIPWSPLGKGLLTRPWGTQTTRSQSDRSVRLLDPPAVAEMSETGLIPICPGTRRASSASPFSLPSFPGEQAALHIMLQQRYSSDHTL